MKGLELKVPPPLVTAAIAVAMYVADRAIPELRFDFPAHHAVGAVFATAGVAISLAGVWAFRRHRTTVNPLQPGKTTSLVTDGVYRWTRNPMYLGFLGVLTGWAFWLANAVAVAGLPLLMMYLTIFQILPEERMLRKIFGSELATYAQRVRRWL